MAKVPNLIGQEEKKPKQYWKGNNTYSISTQGINQLISDYVESELVTARDSITTLEDERDDLIDKVEQLSSALESVSKNIEHVSYIINDHV